MSLYIVQKCNQSIWGGAFSNHGQCEKQAYIIISENVEGNHLEDRDVDARNILNLKKQIVRNQWRLLLYTAMNLRVS
jgi:hypothetical protein